jgi:hypothetical protein
MNDYIVIFNLPDLIDENFISLIPSHRLKVNELLEEGKIKSYSLSADRSKLWVVIKAESEMEVDELLSTLPLQHRMMDYEIVPLMFSQVTYQFLPALSLN